MANIVKVKVTKLDWHSGGMYRSSYYTTEKVDLEVWHRGKENGVNGKDVGPFLKVGDIYLTKKQAEELSRVIAEEAVKM